MREVIAGIFVGGKGSRMAGAAKGLLVSPSGESILASQRLALSRIGVPHVLVGEHPAYAAEGLEMLRDDPRADGPLGGLLALLDRARGGYAIVLACDMPFVDERALRRLLEAPAARAVAPRRAGRWEPFFARYDAGLSLPIAATLAAQGVRSLQTLLDRAEAHELDLDLGAEVLDDWDTPEDLRGRGASSEC